MEPESRIQEIPKQADPHATVEIRIADGKVDVRPSSIDIWGRDPGDVIPPGYPRQVRWVAIGLERGESVIIAAKPPSSHEVFDQPFFELNATNRERWSGRSRKAKDDPKELHWKYEAVLHRTEGETRFDPEVIIKDYP